MKKFVKLSALLFVPLLLALAGCSGGNGPLGSFGLNNPVPDQPGGGNLATSGRVVGTVTTDGEGPVPVSGVTVFTTDGVNTWETTTDENGDYVLDDVSAGARIISFYGYGWFSQNSATVVSDGTVTVGADMDTNSTSALEPPVVTVDTPDAENTTGTATITGQIDGLDIQQGVIIVNGSAALMTTSAGAFSSVAILQPGVNTIYVYAVNAAGRDIEGPFTITYTPSGDVFFRVTLTWDGPGDIDLHNWDPNMQHSAYWNMAIPTGELDVDNTVQDGPENFTCNMLAQGRYRVAVNSYSLDDEPRHATLRVFVNSGPNAGRTYTFGPYLFSSANYQGDYPVTGDTAYWWRPCDVLVSGSTISVVTADATPLLHDSTAAMTRTVSERK